MHTKYFITDVDGVIFDRMPIQQNAFVEVMQPFDIPEPLLRAHYYDTLGTPIELQIKAALSRFGFSVDEEKLEEIVKDFWAIVARQKVNLFPGVKEALDKIKSEGMFLMASSGSRTADLDKHFREYGLPYDFFLGSDKIFKGDKHIEIFAEHFNLEKSEFCHQAAMIGDGTTDMQIASRNDIFGIGITNTLPREKLLDAGARAIISEIGEIFNCLE